MAYEATLARVESYFDRTATQAWARLTSDAPVSRIRATVRKGRDAMRQKMLAQLPMDLDGARVLDAGCGPGQMSAALAARGAQVTGIDISPQLIALAEARLAPALRRKADFKVGDMLAMDLGRFDYVLAMDSLIYYDSAEIHRAVAHFLTLSDQLVFTVAPRTPLLMAMWYAGKAFPRSDRSPVMVPHSPDALVSRHPALARLGRVTSGFYISEALEGRA